MPACGRVLPTRRLEVGYRARWKPPYCSCWPWAGHHRLSSIRVTGSGHPFGLAMRPIPGITRGIRLLPISPLVSFAMQTRTRVSGVPCRERGTGLVGSRFTPGTVRPSGARDFPALPPGTVAILVRLRSPARAGRSIPGFAAFLSRGFNHEFTLVSHESLLASPTPARGSRVRYVTTRAFEPSPFGQEPAWIPRAPWMGGSLK